MPSPGRFAPGKDPVPTVQEAGWAPGPVWTGAENLAPQRDSNPDRPVRSESLYRLSYRGPPATGAKEHKTRQVADTSQLLAHGRYGEQERCVQKFGAETMGRGT